MTQYLMPMTLATKSSKKLRTLTPPINLHFHIKTTITIILTQITTKSPNIIQIISITIMTPF